LSSVAAIAVLPSWREYAPVSRFSSIVRCAKQCRPSITWITPRSTMSEVLSRSMRSPRSAIEPFVTSPRCPSSRLLTARNVVVLPAPLAPSRATTAPSRTCSETPFSTRMTWL